MSNLLIARNNKVVRLTPATLDAALIERYQSIILLYSVKFERARKKETRMRYRQEVRDAQRKLDELTEDRSIKLDN